MLILAAAPGVPAAAAAARRPAAADLVATAVTPATAANNVSTPITIQGDGFTGETTVALGKTLLATSFVTSTELSATVPWGLEPGHYDLTLANPNQSPYTLANAFTVTLGIGKWINNGPFGGQVNDLVFQQGDPPRLYAAVLNAGLFVSTDGGANWQMLINDSFPMQIMVSPADPQVIYLNTNRAIRRSLDGGLTWSSIAPTPATPGGTLAAFPHPTEPGTVIVAASPDMNNYQAGGSGELYLSTDHGDTLTPLANAGLSDKRITALAFDPRDAAGDTLLAGTIAGKVFLTTDGGQNWSPKADLAQVSDQQPARVDRLLYNPSGDREPWAVKRNPFLPTDWPVLYRSNADLSAWNGVMVVDDPIGGPHPWFWMRPWSLTFTADTIWTGYDTGYTSPNAATLTWTPLVPGGIPDENWRTFEFTVFAMDPAHTNVIYGGTRAHGIYKSVDGGQTWAASNQGLAGVNPYALAIAPDNLDEVYAVSQTDGVAKSTDGGQHWTSLGFLRDGMPWQQTSLVVDQHDPQVVYLGKWCPDSRHDKAISASDACVRISRDRGQTWSDVILPQPPPADFEHGEVFAIAVDPHQPGRVIAGATFYPYDWSQNVEHPYGAFYYSDDYGATWTRSEVDAAQVKGSYVIAYDGGDSPVAYAGTDGTGLWKSEDSGVTWSRVSWSGCADTGEGDVSVSVHAVVTRPKVGGEVYASCTVKVGQEVRSNGLFRSIDAGLTWEPVQTPPGGMESLAFVQSPTGLALYAGGWGGAARSLDRGQSWAPIDGVPAGAVYALAGWADADRAVVYISTEAGMSAPTRAERLSAGPRLMAGGTYGLTQRLPKPWAYIPLIFRQPQAR